MINIVAIRANGLTVTSQAETLNDAIAMVTGWVTDPRYGFVSDSPIYFAGTAEGVSAAPGQTEVSIALPLQQHRADEFIF